MDTFEQMTVKQRLAAQKADKKADERLYFKALGARIAQYRQGLGLSQKQLAKLIGVHQQTLFSYEWADRRLSLLTLPRLSKVFGITIEVLLDVTHPVPEEKKLSPAVVEMVERIQRLPATKQRFIMRLIELLERELDEKRAQHPANLVEGRSDHDGEL